MTKGVNIMLTVYNTFMPFRIMEEIRFWKMREKENVHMLLQLPTGLEPQYVQLLTAWQDVLHKTETAVHGRIATAIQSQAATPHTHQSVKETMKQAVKQSEDLSQHLHELTKRSAALSTHPLMKTIIHHLIRESDYFIGIFRSLLDKDILPNTWPPHASIPNAPPLREQQNKRQEDTSMSLPHSWSEPIAQRPVPIGGHTLPPLPYAYDALEPHIDEETMRLHHDRHHRSYVNNLNRAEKALELARDKNDYSLIKHWLRELSFNGAGHYLHTIFWNNMSPTGGGKAFGPIAAQINQQFDNFDKFKAHFTQAAKEVEGGGWAILVWGPRSHRLEILQAEKHQNLSQWDVIPLLVLDVWEHAYYLKYNNNRDQYINAWWQLVNWHDVNERFVKARQLKWKPF